MCYKNEITLNGKSNKNCDLQNLDDTALKNRTG